MPKYSPITQGLADAARQIVLEHEPGSHICGGMEIFVSESLEQGTIHEDTPPTDIARQYLQHAIIGTGLLSSNSELRAYRALDAIG